MQRLFLVLCLSLVLLGSPAKAGIEAGRQAYEAGEYAGTLAHCQPMDEAGTVVARY